MSVVSRHYAIVCDGEGCQEESEPRFGTSLSPQEYAEDLWALYDWTYEPNVIASRHFCPKCSRERALASSENAGVQAEAPHAE